MPTADANCIFCLLFVFLNVLEVFLKIFMLKGFEFIFEVVGYSVCWLYYIFVFMLIVVTEVINMIENSED